MPFKICFVYPWATFGGVERILLNRALAFKSSNANVEISVFFLHDSGGLNILREAIAAYELEGYFQLVDSLSDQFYDLISLIDCPQVLPLVRRHRLRHVVECHTAYCQNRVYLKTLGSECQAVWVPGQRFADEIAKELPKNLPLRVMRNFVPWDVENSFVDVKIPMTSWKRKPLFFFGRMDAHKDPLALFDAFSQMEEQHPGRFMLVLCGPTSPEISIEKELYRRKLRQHTVILPPIRFSRSGQLLRTIAQASGIFVSPSRGESFGLSAAEAIAFGLPVVLSDIDAHGYLVDGNESFLYPIGNANALSEKIVAIANDYDRACRNLRPLRRNFSADAFLEDWNHAVQCVHRV